MWGDEIEVGPEKECIWTADYYDNYVTSCGETFPVAIRTPKESNMKFCTFCGGKLIEEGSEPNPEGAGPEDNKAGRDYEQIKKEGGQINE